MLQDRCEGPLGSFRDKRPARCHSVLCREDAGVSALDLVG